MRIRQEIWLMVDFSNNTSRRDRRKLWHQAQLERFRASSKHAQRREVYKYGIQIVWGAWKIFQKRARSDSLFGRSQGIQDDREMIQGQEQKQHDEMLERREDHFFNFETHWNKSEGYFHSTRAAYEFLRHWLYRHCGFSIEGTKWSFLAKDLETKATRAPLSIRTVADTPLMSTRNFKS